MNCNFRTIISLTSLLLFFFSCKDVQESNDNFKAKFGGTLNIVIVDPVETLDPVNIIYDSDWKISHLLFEGLVTFGEKLDDVVPQLAEEWKVYDSGKRIVVKLKEDVKFQDDPCFKNAIGREMTAYDVVFTFNRLASPNLSNVNWALFENKIVGINNFHSGEADSIVGITALSKFEVEFRLTKPYFNFLKTLSAPSSYIIPREAVEYYGENFYKHPVGTGPFRLTEWNPLTDMVFVKNENYWQSDDAGRKLPYLEKIKIDILHNRNLVLPEFLKNECQLIEVPNSLSNSLAKDSSIISKYKFYDCNNGFTIRFLGFSTEKKKSLVSNKKFRKSLAYAIDRTSLISSKNANINLANTLIPNKFYSNKTFAWYPHNFKKVYELLNTIENPGSYPPINILSTVDLEAFNQLKELEKYGCDFTVDISAEKYFSKIVNDRPDIFYVSMKPSFPDMEEYFALFYSKSSSAINLTQYKSKEFDEIFEKAIVVKDKDLRQKLFVNLEEILKRDVPLILLTHENSNKMIAPKFVKNLRIKFGLPELKNVWLDE